MQLWRQFRFSICILFFYNWKKNFSYIPGSLISFDRGLFCFLRLIVISRQVFCIFVFLLQKFVSTVVICTQILWVGILSRDLVLVDYLHECGNAVYLENVFCMCSACKAPVKWWHQIWIHFTTITEITMKLCVDRIPSLNSVYPLLPRSRLPSTSAFTLPVFKALPYTYMHALSFPWVLYSACAVICHFRL